MAHTGVSTHGHYMRVYTYNYARALLMGMTNVSSEPGCDKLIIVLNTMQSVMCDAVTIVYSDTCRGVS